MRYLLVLGFMIALALVISQTATRLTQHSSGPSPYGAATGAAQHAAGAAEQHVQDVLKTTLP